jgi:GntR family transcriptional regulator
MLLRIQMGARYVNIADQIAREVRDLQPFTQLPTEHQFAKRYGVSRVTIRRALSLLERGGQITRQPGRGTIVSPRKLTRHLVPACSINEDFQDQGASLESTVLGFEPRTSATDEICGYFNLGKRSALGKLELLHRIDDHIICHDLRYFPPRVADHLDIGLVGTRSLSEIVENITGQAIILSDIETDISPAPTDVARKLKITPGMLVATHTFVEYLQDQAPIQLGIMSYRVDRVKFKIVQTGAPFTRRVALPLRPPKEMAANTQAGGRENALGRKSRRKQ